MSNEGHDSPVAEELARLRAENEALKAKQRTSGALAFKVSEKGAVSVYGLGRFPVTLYQEQWEKLAAAMDELKQFIAANRHVLKKKDAASQG
jgi:hypothetical protein